MPEPFAKPKAPVPASVLTVTSDVKMKSSEEVAFPEVVSTVIFPVVAPAGTCTVRRMGDAIVIVAGVPLNLTVLFAAVDAKLIPVMTTTVPAAPVVGAKLTIEIEPVASVTVKSVGDMPTSPSTSMVILPDVDPAGTVAVKLVDVDAETEADLPLNFTTFFAGVAEKLAPVIVTTDPTEPEPGENAVMDGTDFAGVDGSSLSLHAVHKAIQDRLTMIITYALFMGEF